MSTRVITPTQSGRKRQSVLGLIMGIVLSVGAVHPAWAAPATSVPPPPTLTGETLSGTTSASENSGLCPTATYMVNGTATGPYPGTFSETGTVSVTQFSATFTIVSGSTLITGTKSFPFGGCGDGFGLGLSAAAYTAVINTPDGIFSDTGTSLLGLNITGSTAVLHIETYASSLTQTVLHGTQPPNAVPPFGPTSSATVPNEDVTTAEDAESR